MDRPADPVRPRSRLFATIVGIDAYDHPGFARLEGAARDARLVFNALSRTRMSTTEVVGRLLVSGGEAEPTRAVLVEALSRVAADAGPRDTVLIHFSGHGVIAGGKVALVPRDADPARGDSLLSVEAIQELFRESTCPRRAILLDACQELLAPEAPDAAAPAAPSDVATRGAGTYRTRGRVSSEFVDALPVERSGWVLVTSCGPGELSLESDEVDHHGLFSYYTALGLRGEADLDGDGTVGLGELVQYLANKVPWEARRASRGFLTQTPQLVCRGQISAFTDDGGARGDAETVHRRRLAPPPGFAAAWRQALGGRWPFEPLTAWWWLILGGGALYGLVMGLEVLLFLGTHGAAWGAAAVVGGVSLVLWPVLAAFALAAAPLRYHHGGYVSGAVMVLWHAAVFAALVGLGRPAQAADPEAVRRLIHFGAALFIHVCVMVVLGFNAIQTILSLLDLERRREEGVLRDFFAEFDRKLLRAELPCTVACETFHPKIYLGVWVAVTLALLAHMAAILLKPDLAGADGLTFLRDVVLWVLVSWQVSGYNAMYMQIRRKHPMRVNT